MSSYPQPPYEPESPDHSAGTALPPISEEHLVQSALRVIRKRGWIALVCIAGGLMLAALINLISKPVYMAKSNLLVTPDSASQFRLEGSNADGVDAVKIDTEMEILRSTTLALQTISTLDLQDNPDFIKQMPQRKWDLARYDDRRLLSMVFQGHLNITRVGHTNIITIAYSLGNAKLAATICNKLVETYKEHNFQDNYQATSEVSRWLEAQLGDLRTRLSSSQSKMLELQQDIGLVGMDDKTQSTITVQLEELSQQLVRAEGDNLVAQAKLIALKSSPPNVVDILSGDSITSALRMHRILLTDLYSQATTKYGPNHPRVKDAKQQLDDLDAQIKSQETSILQRTQKEVESTKNSENLLQGAIDRVKAESFDSNSKVIQYALARREYESARTLYDGLESRLQEAGIMAGLHSTSIRVVDPADPPTWPATPKKGLNLLLGFSGGFALGALLILLTESLDTNVKTIADVEESLGLPLLGVIPQTTNAEIQPLDFIVSAKRSGAHGWSQIAEAYRALRTSILLSGPGGKPRVLLFTSSRPSEGKTSAVICEAIVLALSGARVLLVDADMRRPTVHSRFRLPNNIGLSTVLVGESAFKDTIHSIKEVPSLHILSAGPSAPLPAELLGSESLRKLLETARKDFDFILFDTPPILTVTDAAVLAPQCDGVVVILRYGETAKNAVTRAGYLLQRAGGKVLGVVLNAVDFKSPDYSEYYGRSYSTYYKRDQQDEFEE
jgi:capsular exopolysaccharide synthesis family protein